MSGKIIAFSGKGGSGKTTLASMTLRRLVRDNIKPILAVDADPNATFAMSLGLGGPETTISDLRDRMGQAARQSNQTPKDRLMDQWLAEILREQDGFDLLTMGRPEGRNCYCYVNGLLRRYLSMLRNNYACVIVDCQAGMEYLSRMVIDEVQAIVMVAENTPIGLTAASRVAKLVDSLDLHVNKRVLAINKISTTAGLDDKNLPDIPSLDTIIRVPYDGDIAKRSAAGQPIDDGAGFACSEAIDELVRAFEDLK